MASVADLVENAALESLATPSNRRLGRQIVAEGGVELTTFAPLHVTATVGPTPASPQKRTVDLRVEDGRLRWSCTCTRRADLFCKHCVAAAVIAWERAPKRL